METQGSGIFLTPAGVLSQLHSVSCSLLVWFLCGIVSILGILQKKTTYRRLFIKRAITLISRCILFCRAGVFDPQSWIRLCLSLRWIREEIPLRRFTGVLLCMVEHVWQVLKENYSLTSPILKTFFFNSNSTRLNSCHLFDQR